MESLEAQGVDTNYTYGVECNLRPKRSLSKPTLKSKTQRRHPLKDMNVNSSNNACQHNGLNENMKTKSEKDNDTAVELVCSQSIVMRPIEEPTQLEKHCAFLRSIMSDEMYSLVEREVTSQIIDPDISFDELQWMLTEYLQLTSCDEPPEKKPAKRKKRRSADMQLVEDAGNLKLIEDAELDTHTVQQNRRRSTRLRKSYYLKNQMHSSESCDLDDPPTVTPELENVYRQKDFVAPTTSKLPTIFEEPKKYKGHLHVFSKSAHMRSFSFTENYWHCLPSHKIQYRRRLGSKHGWTAKKMEQSATYDVLLVKAFEKMETDDCF